MTIQPIPRSKKVWHALRRKHVTASEVAPLFGMGADYQCSPFALFHIKAGSVPVPHFESERMEAGTMLEPAIAKWAAKREGWVIRRGVFAIDDSIEGASATLDYRIEPSAALEARGFFGPGALEVKNVDRWVYEQNWEGDEPPPHIALQHQQQLACTGWTWGAVAVCRGGNELTIIYYHARDGIIASIRDAITDFWARVRENRPYAVDHFESTRDTLKQLYKPVEDTYLDLAGANDVPVLAGEYEALDAESKRIGKRMDEIKAEFRLRLGAYKSAGYEGFRLSRSVGEDTPDRPALPGEIIRGRKGQDRLTIAFPKPKAAKVSKPQASDMQVAA